MLWIRGISMPKLAPSKKEAMIIENKAILVRAGYFLRYLKAMRISFIIYAPLGNNFQ